MTTLCLAAAIYASSFFFLWKKRGISEGLTDNYLGAFVLSLGQVLATSLVLGWLRLFFAPALVGLNLMISLILVFLSRPSFADLRILVVEHKKPARHLKFLLAGKPLVGIAMIIFIFALLWNIYAGWVLPERSWDSLRYHLPIAAQMAQNHDAAIVATDTPFLNNYPRNFEILYSWTFLLQRSDRWLHGVQIPFLLAGILAVFRLCRLSGVSRRSSGLAAVLLAGCPVLLQQLTVSMIDVMMAMTVILAIFFFYRFLRFREKTDVCLSGMAAGVMAGAKASGVFILVLLAAVLAGMAVVMMRKGDRKAGFLLVYFLIPALSLASSWYVRNWIASGNPIAPYRVQFLGREIFPGDKDPAAYLVEEKIGDELRPLSPLERLWKTWHDETLFFDFFGAGSGLGSLWFAFLLPAIPVAFFLGRLHGIKYLVVLYSLFLIPFAVFLRYQSVTRYSLFILALGCLSLGIVLDASKTAGKVLTALIVPIFAITVGYGSLSKTAATGEFAHFAKLPSAERTPAAIFPYGDSGHGTRELFLWWSRQERARTRLGYRCRDWIFTYPLWNRPKTNRVDYIGEAVSAAEWHRLTDPYDWLLVSGNSRESDWTEKSGRFVKVFDDGKDQVFKKAS